MQPNSFTWQVLFAHGDPHEKFQQIFKVCTDQSNTKLQ